MGKCDSILILGKNGFVGSAIVRVLQNRGYSRLLIPAQNELNLLDQRQVDEYFLTHRIDVVFMAAGKVGGIQQNLTEPADFLYQNAMMAVNVMGAAARQQLRSQIQKLVYLGSSCMYPPQSPQPFAESSLLTGAFETTNEAYALAKMVGLKLCSYYSIQHKFPFYAAIPTSLYGPRDCFDPKRAHVIPALMRRIHDAKLEKAPYVVIWGSGAAKREFLHVDDCAEALVVLLEQYSEAAPINIGSGFEITIQALAEKIAKIVGYCGELRFDPSKPEGMARKALNGRKMNGLSWAPQRSFEEGLEETYRWALENDRLSLRF